MYVALLFSMLVGLYSIGLFIIVRLGFALGRIIGGRCRISHPSLYRLAALIIVRGKESQC